MRISSYEKRLVRLFLGLRREDRSWEGSDEEEKEYYSLKVSYKLAGLFIFDGFIFRRISPVKHSTGS